ncbi:hypothetical protein B1790_08895 [Mycobacterium sp. AT1]|nr:hypothetical protein B1790_08895 [Mycobacterium sp. AT1]
MAGVDAITQLPSEADVHARHGLCRRIVAASPRSSVIATIALSGQTPSNVARRSLSRSGRAWSTFFTPRFDEGVFHRLEEIRAVPDRTG